jgi:membrane protein implicated in regulation of membrane protease activity
MDLYWLASGIVLIVLELVVPGAILMFLGGGALVVALLLRIGVLDHWMGAFTTWFVVSLALIIVFRSMVQRFSGGKSDRESTDEDLDAAGTVVTVTETIRPGGQGRIRYRGTTWPAICHDRVLEIDAKARLIRRENLAWVVEPGD